MLTQYDLSLEFLSKDVLQLMIVYCQLKPERGIATLSD